MRPISRGRGGRAGVAWAAGVNSLMTNIQEKINLFTFFCFGFDKDGFLLHEFIGKRKRLKNQQISFFQQIREIKDFMQLLRIFALDVSVWDICDIYCPMLGQGAC